MMRHRAALVNPAARRPPAPAAFFAGARGTPGSLGSGQLAGLLQSAACTRINLSSGW
jgi:hypothetical protein